MSGPVDTYLDSCLAPLAAYLSQPDVTDIYINRPGELWVEALGRDPIRYDMPDLTSALLARLSRQVAAVSAQGISREHPLLAASLPTGERVQIIMPPATRSDIAIAIRKHVIKGFSLEEYAGTGAFDGLATVTRAAEVDGDRAWSPLLDPVATLRTAIRDRRNVLISGGTSTGKTTFLNMLSREIPPTERLILIEDTPELQLTHANAVGLLAVRGTLGEADVSAEDLLVASMRMRPDRIILGEIRGSEAMTFLRAINTGHPGSISTIHADSPTRAIEQLALLVLQTGSQMGWDDIVGYARRSVDIIVQLERRIGTRRVVAISDNRADASNQASNDDK